MNFKNILFVTSLLLSPCLFSFSLPIFLHAQDSSKKYAFSKMGVGVALFSAGLVEYDSIPVSFTQNAFGLTGVFIGLSGIYQLLIALDTDEEAQKLMRSPLYKYNRLIHNLAHDERFLAGAALSLSGLALSLASQNSSASSLACTVLGMALMGWAAHEPVKKEIKNFINT